MWLCRSELTFQSRYTSRAKIRTPARTATSMIHQGTPPCCATVLSGDTMTLTWREREGGGGVKEMHQQRQGKKGWSGGQTLSDSHQCGAFPGPRFWPYRGGPARLWPQPPGATETRNPEEEEEHHHVTVSLEETVGGLVQMDLPRWRWSSTVGLSARWLYRWCSAGGTAAPHSAALGRIAAEERRDCIYWQSTSRGSNQVFA